MRFIKQAMDTNQFNLNKFSNFSFFSKIKYNYENIQETTFSVTIKNKNLTKVSYFFYRLGKYFFPKFS